jgi:membrane protein YqaA with SNARE-associated domain
MMRLIFTSGVILGGLLGVLVGHYVLQRWQQAWRRTQDIERLVEQFQTLFRQRSQEHPPRP